MMFLVRARCDVELSDLIALMVFSSGLVAKSRVVFDDFLCAHLLLAWMLYQIQQWEQSETLPERKQVWV